MPVKKTIRQLVDQVVVLAENMDTEHLADIREQYHRKHAQAKLRLLQALEETPERYLSMDVVKQKWNISDIREENRQLNAAIKTLFKKNHVPAFCNTKMYYCLFSPKGMSEFLELLVILLVICGGIPAAVIAILMNTKFKTGNHTAMCVLIAALPCCKWNILSVLDQYLHLIKQLFCFSFFHVYYFLQLWLYRILFIDPVSYHLLEYLRNPGSDVC